MHGGSGGGCEPGIQRSLRSGAPRRQRAGQGDHPRVPVSNSALSRAEKRPLDREAAANRSPQRSAVEANPAQGEVGHEGASDSHYSQPAQTRQIERCLGTMGHKIREGQPQALPYGLHRKLLLV
jgi:hypothetical protein